MASQEMKVRAAEWLWRKDIFDWRHRLVGNEAAGQISENDVTIELLCAFAAAERALVLAEVLAIIAEPYGDIVKCYGGDEPRTVSNKMAAAIRALASPAGEKVGEKNG